MISPRTQATLLLTLHLTARDPGAPQPLDVREWNRLARWLHGQELTPEALLRGNPASLMAEWEDARIGVDQVLALLDRGPALALALDRWLGTGLWVLGRSDPGYPARLRQRLKESAPPVLFGYGEQRHFENQGVAIVGSRDALANDLQLAHDLGQAVSVAGYNVVSGGARGIDERAADGAFEAEGTVIAVVADSLLRNAGKKQYRDHLMAGDLLLVTPYSPDAGFSAGNAMGRNRLIYCLADTSVAVSSTNGSGGTFSGASQNLRAGWVPLWVAPADDPGSGNAALVEQGAGWLSSRDQFDVEALFTWPERATHHADSRSPIQGTLF